MTELDPASLENVTSRRAFSGFLQRAAAFLADCFVLGAVAYLISEAAGAPLSAVKPWLPLLGQLLVFHYFWLMEGVSGKGQTFGKKLLAIRVVGPTGEQPRSGQAARRTLLKLPVFLPILDVRLLGVLLPVAARPAFFLAFQALGIAAVTYLIALAAGVAIHPRKRGWHDLWAGTLVTRDPIPAVFHETLAAEMDPLTAGRLRNHVKMTLVFWLIATAALLVRPVQLLSDPEMKDSFRRIEAVDAAHAIPPYKIMAIEFPHPGIKAEFEMQVRQYRLQTATAGRDALTTDALRSHMDDGQTIRIAAVLPRGRFNALTLQDPVFQGEVEDLRKDLWRLWQRQRSQSAVALPPALAFEVLLTDPYQLLFEPLVMLFKNESEAKARVVGRPEPDSGKLRYELLPRPHSPVAEDRPTTL